MALIRIIKQLKNNLKILKTELEIVKINQRKNNFKLHILNFHHQSNIIQFYTKKTIQDYILTHTTNQIKIK